jgi:DNA repair protein RecO (recombination protein O)
MLKRTEGIVLKTFPFGEADLIVTYLTPDYGIIKLFAKSPRKIKSRFGSSLEPLTRSRISFWGKEETALPRLTQSDIIHPFQSVRNSLNCFLRVSEIIELTISFMPERDTNSEAYPLLLDTLRNIENNLAEPPSVKIPLCRPFIKEGGGGLKGKSGSPYRDLLLSHYKIKFLELVGFAPNLDVCGRCTKKGHHFYISQGSILCEPCAKGETARADIGPPIKLSPPVLKFYSDLLTWDTAKIKRIKPSDTLLSELSEIINMHIKYILSKSLKSEAFIRSLPG